MTSSGIKRGLATSAITALAVTGLPALAYADAAPASPAVQLIAPFNDGLELRPSPSSDDAPGTVRLEAAVFDPDGESGQLTEPDPTDVVFQYNTNENATDTSAGWTTIPTNVPAQNPSAGTFTRDDNGYAAVDWNPALVADNSISVRAYVAPEDVDAAATAAPYTSIQNNVILRSETNVDIDRIDVTDGNEKGFFDGNYSNGDGRPTDGPQVIVSGTTETPTTESVEVSYFDTASNAFQGQSNATVIPSAEGVYGQFFAGVVGIGGYLQDGDNDEGQIALGAEAGTDDVEAYDLYQQQLISADAAGEGEDSLTQVDSAPGSTGGNGSVTLQVNDDTGAPVAGVEIARQSTTGGAPTIVGYTNAFGQLTVSQPSGTNRTYFANANDSDAYEPATDPREDVTVGVFDARATDTTFVTADGVAFDFDEFASGDVYVLVTDEQNDDGTDSTPVPVQGATVEYSVFAPNTNIPANPTYNQTATTDSQGRAALNIPTSGATGEYEVRYRVQRANQAPLTDANRKNAEEEGPAAYFAGESTLQLGTFEDTDGLTATPDVFVPADNASFPAGTQDNEIFGRLILRAGPDEQIALPSRLVTFSYTRGRELAPGDQTTDSGIQSNQANNPIVLTRTVRANGGSFETPEEISGTDTTPAAPGVFSVSVRDREEQTQGSEIDNNLSAATANNTSSQQVGLDGVASQATLDGNAGASDAIEIDFNQGNSPQDLTLTQLSRDDLSAGRLITYRVRVTGSTGQAIDDDTPVTVTLSDGNNAYLTDGDDGATADDGVYDNDGKSKQYFTRTVGGESGIVTVQFVINRDAGFDDDGEVDVTISAESVNGASDSDEYTFSSETNPRGGDLSITRSDDALQDSTNEAGAQATDDDVLFDVKTTDTFGNLVGGVDVTITDDTAAADFSDLTDSGNGDNIVTTDYDADPDLVASATREEDIVQTLTGRGTVGPDNVSDSATATYYAIDYAGSTYTLENNTDGDPVRTGSTVVETFTAIDQNGEPITSLLIDFFRTGPDDEQDGESILNRPTNQNGQATYVFQGESAGTARVTTSASQKDDTLIPQGTLTDVVTFEGPGGGGGGGGTGTDEPRNPTINLKGRNNGRRADRLLVQGPAYTAGGTVRLFRTGLKNRPRQLVAVKQTNANGDVRFRVRDNNRKRFTQYRAFLAPSLPDYTRAVSNRRQVR